DSLERSDRSEVLIAAIPGGVVGPRGVDYWVEVNTVTSMSPLTFPAAHPDARPDMIRVTVRGLTEPGPPHPGGRYRLLGLPLDFRETLDLGALLSSQLGDYDPIHWRAFRYFSELDSSV